MAYGEHFLNVCSSTIFAAACLQYSAFIKQMCKSARKVNAATQTKIKRLFKHPNLLP